MSSMLLNLGAPCALLLVEDFYLRGALPYMYEKSSYGLERAYAGVYIAVVASSMCMFMLMGKVAKARKEYRDKAIEAKEPNGEANFSYPKLYAGKCVYVCSGVVCCIGDPRITGYQRSLSYHFVMKRK